nr:hypothetical protein [Tanacetum cinerariifolium]
MECPWVDPSGSGRIIGLIPNLNLLMTPSVARKFLNEEAAKFVRDFKSVANEADESLAKHKALEFKIERLLRVVVVPKVVETSDLSKPITSNLVPTTTESKVVTNDKVIAPVMFWINPFKTSRNLKLLINFVCKFLGTVCFGNDHVAAILDGDMCIYALTVSTMELRNVKEDMIDPAWIVSMQEELLKLKNKHDDEGLVPAPDNIKPLL